MVDPIEIKLDEIEEHVLKTQADVDRLMRDFSKPEKGKEILAQLPSSGGGGFMDTLIGKMTGGKGAGMMAAGGMAGLAAAGIMKLADILGEAVSNSKILTTVLGTIGKALGLLIDIILLPFLPILTTGIIWLFQGIMAFHRLWSSIWNSKVIQDVKMWLEKLSGFFATGVSAFFKIGFDFLGDKAAEVYQVLKWVYDLAVTGGNALVNIVFSSLGFVWDVLSWLWHIVTTNIMNNINIGFSVLGEAWEFLKWLWNTILSGGANLAINLTSGFENAASSVGKSVVGAASDPLGWLGGALNQIGGAVGGAASTASTIVIQGYTDQKLVKTIEDIQRRQNNRYNA